MPTSTCQSSPPRQPVTVAATPHVFVTPIVRETPHGLGEPVSFAFVW